MRLTGATSLDFSDTFSYTGLGMRLTKNDSTGGYANLTDGVFTFTPGLRRNLCLFPFTPACVPAFSPCLYTFP